MGIPWWPICAVAIVPDGTWFATGDYGRVRIWDAATWQQRVVLTTDTKRVTLTRHPNQVEAVAIAPDATWLAAADLRSVHIWDTATGTQRAILTGPVRAMAIAPGGAWLATVGTAGGQRHARSGTRPLGAEEQPCGWKKVTGAAHGARTVSH